MNPGRRKIIRIRFTEIPPKLKELVLKVPEDSSFYKRHGHLLSLVTTRFDEGLMSVLFQFFDPKHHYFTFPDYQLVPTVIGGSGTDCLTLVREMSRKQESPASFIFSKGKGQKHRKIPYRDCSRFGR